MRVQAALFPLEDGEAPDHIEGIAIRHDALSPVHWEFRLKPGSVAASVVVDGMAILWADGNESGLPRRLLPYQPPSVVLLSDGSVHSVDGAALRADFLAVARVLRVQVRSSLAEEVDACVRILRGEKQGESLDPSHPIVTPLGRVVLGPQLELSG